MREDINVMAITIQDCLVMYEYKNKATIINDGKIIGFEKEN